MQENLPGFKQTLLQNMKGTYVTGLAHPVSSLMETVKNGIKSSGDSRGEG